MTTTRTPREVLTEYDAWHDCLAADAPITTRDDLANALREALVALAKTSEDAVALAKHFMDERDALKARASELEVALAASESRRDKYEAALRLYADSDYPGEPDAAREALLHGPAVSGSRTEPEGGK